MSKNIKYIKEDKVYIVKRKKIKNIFVCLIIPAILFSLLGGFLITSSVNYNKKSSVISYNEKGNVDYKVYLKDNDYYKEKFLRKNMQYIASLINTVNVLFRYEIHSTSNIDYNYKYRIIANTRVVDKQNNQRVLYENEEKLLDGVSKKVSGNSFLISEDVDIDYDKYNDYVNSFRSEYGLSANCELVLTMLVDVDGKADSAIEDMKSNQILQLVIPLSEQTVDIKMDSSNINNSGSISTSVTLSIKNVILFISGLLIIINGIVFLIYAIYLYERRSNKDPYQRALHKILKEHDTNIVNAKNTFKESTNIIRVDNFDELMDAQKIENTPILFYEVEPGSKSYFVVKGAKNIYRFTLTRAFQEKEKMRSLNKEVEK